jgi:hypothetical protein
LKRSSIQIYKELLQARRQQLAPVILAHWEAEIRRIMVQSQPRQIDLKTLSQKKTHHKKRAGGMAQVEE